MYIYRERDVYVYDIYIYIYIYIYMSINNWLTDNNNVSIIPLHCTLWGFHPIFGWMQFILNLENRKYIILFKNNSNVDGKIFQI